MSRKFVIACAALASIATATLVSSVTDAEAARGGGFAVSRGGGRMIHAAPRAGFHGIHRVHRVGIGRHHLRPIRHFHPIRRHVHGVPIWRHRHGWCWRHPWHCRARYVAWRPYVYAAAAPAVVATAYAATPTVSRCTCLTKEYLPDGSALFRDLCTKEEALMPNPNLQTSEAPLVAPPVK